MTADQTRLLEAAQRAQRYFDNIILGNGLNGPSDVITIARDLDAAIAAHAQAQQAEADRLALAQIGAGR